MKLRSILKIALYCLLPSVAVILLAQPWRDFATTYFPQLGELATNPVVARNLGWTGVWVAAALFLATLLGYLLSPERAVRRNRRAMPALLRDLIRYSVFVFVVAMVLHFVWGESVAPIFGALGIGGVVLGFALQETLSNFFAGLALLLEQPFTQGDWIKIGEKAEGEVEHITWRATKIRTRDNDYQIFPNSVVAKEVIVNFKQPSTVHALRLQIGASYNDSPDLVKRTLLEVVESVPRILKQPAPTVHLKAYADFSINYEVKCFIEDYERRPAIEDDAMQRIWYAFRRAGIEIPFPTQTVFEHRVRQPAGAAGSKAIDPAKVLATVPIFTTLGKEQIDALVSASRMLNFGRGEAVIRQGDPGDTLYAIVGGLARVAIRADDGSEKDVARLGPGEVFGEMSLLTGDPRTATVYAADGSLVLVEVSKAALLPILTEHPELSEKMAEIVTLRKQGLDRAQAESALDAARRSEVKTAAQGLVGRIRKFFRI